MTRGPNRELIAISPQEALLHEMVHSLADAEGTSPTGIDTTVPPPDDCTKAESQTIGMRSYPNSFPSENSFRDDLGLKPHRATHKMAIPDDPSQIPPPENF